MDELARKLSERSGVKFAPASNVDVEELTRLGAPGDVIDFFRASEPRACAEIDHARLWPVAELVAENREYVPGCDLSQFGFVTIGTTDCGDAYCIDTRAASSDGESPIVLMSHEVDFSGMNEAVVRAHRRVVANSFRDFLERFVAGTLEREPFFKAQS